MKSRTILFVSFFVILIIGIVFVIKFANPAAADSNGNISGYAWSSNIGWISFNGVTVPPSGSGISPQPYGVTKSGDTLLGHAWSSNIGWISFNNDTGTPPSGNAGVKIDSTTGALSGWARAISVIGSCSSEPGTGMKCNSDRGGWDGWISLKGNNYGVTYNGNQLTGYAWGSDVVGWIDFCGAASGNGSYCVMVNDLRAICTAKVNGVVSTTVNTNTPVTWEGTVSGGTGPYNYCWGTTCGDSQVGGDVTGSNSTIDVLSGYPSPQSVTANVKVTDSTGKSGVGVCSIDVQGNPKLTVNLSGLADTNGVVASGAVSASPDGDNHLINTTACTVANSSCSDTYTSGQSVTLTAVPALNLSTPDPNDRYVAAWSNCDSVNGNDCTVTVAGLGRSVSVVFYDQSVSNITLSVAPRTIGIDEQSEGQSAESNAAIISVVGNLTTDYTLRVQSFTSMISGKTIDDIIQNIPGSHDKIRCILRDQNGNEIQNTCSNVSMNIGQSNRQVALKVVVPEKLIQILNNSPYKITVGTGRPGESVDITFEYRVHDIRPR